MAKIKYYAVRKGINPGIYTSWPDCEAQVKGVNGAEYKSFSTEEEADKYMLGEPDMERDNNNDIDSINEKIESCISNLLDEEILAFVDGSYSDAEKKGGYGVVILSNDGSKEKLYRSIAEEYDKDFIELWNIAPELEAAKQAINWAVKNNKRKITVFHDYEGIGKWADGGWKAKKPLTKKYVRFIEDIRKQIEVIFIKVPAHSGVPLNEEADQLAKRSLLEKGYKNYDDGSVYFMGLSTDDWKSVADLINEENSELEEKAADIVLSEELPVE